MRHPEVGEVPGQRGRGEQVQFRAELKAVRRARRRHLGDLIRLPEHQQMVRINVDQ